MAILSWVKSRQVFFKVQEGTGDNLSEADRAAGFVDYCLWSVFKPECLDLDGELPLPCIDGGMLMDKVPLTAEKAFLGCLRQAFGEAIDPCGVLVLLDDADSSSAQ